MSTNEIDALREILRKDYFYLADVGDLVDGFLTVDVRQCGLVRIVVTRTPSDRLLRWKYIPTRPFMERKYSDDPHDRPVYVTEVRREVTVIETSYEVKAS